MTLAHIDHVNVCAILKGMHVERQVLAQPECQSLIDLRSHRVDYIPCFENRRRLAQARVSAVAQRPL